MTKSKILKKLERCVGMEVSVTTDSESVSDPHECKLPRGGWTLIARKSEQVTTWIHHVKLFLAEKKKKYATPAWEIEETI